MYLVAKYKKYLENKKYKKNTIRTYTMHATLFVKWFRSTYDREIDSVITRAAFIDFRRFLEDVLENADGSIRIKSYSMRSFNNFLIQEGYQTNYFVNDKDFEKYREMNTELDIPTEEELELFQCNVEKKGNIRDIAMISLFQEGIKTSICTNLKLSDYNKDSQTISFKKNRRYYTIQIQNSTKQNLDRYIEERYYNVPSEYMFLSNRSDKLNLSTVCRMMRWYSPTITPKSLRNLAVISDIKKGMNRQELRDKYGILSVDYMQKCKEYIGESKGEE